MHNCKLYKCDYCGKEYKERKLLVYHINAVHTGRRPYKCDICPATFVCILLVCSRTYAYTYWREPYLCEVCDRTFSYRSNRNRHRFIHSNKKPLSRRDLRHQIKSVVDAPF